MDTDLNADDPFDVLEDFLHAEDAPADAMTIPVLDGFLAAVAIGPAMIPPSEWVAEVWGDEPPVFDTQEQGAAVTGALLQYYNDTVQGLLCDPPAYGAMLWATPEGGLDGTDWCDGFLAGVSLRAEAWEPLVKSRKHGDCLLPIFAHCFDPNGTPLVEMDAADRAFIRENARALIEGAVILIDRFWKKKRKRPPTGTVVSVSSIEMRAKVGRNDPCPCGSGKKYKMCCLAA